MATFESASVDYRHTARRPGWTELPEPVTAAVCAEIGAVTGVVVAGGGFTPAFAATVTTAGGARYFIKAADMDTEFGPANQREAAVLAVLPADLPVPRVLWSSIVSGWSMVGLEVIDGHMPGQPWSTTDLDAVLTAQATIADALQQPAPGLRAVVDEVSFARLSAEHLDLWRRVSDGSEPIPAGLPWLAAHLADLEALESHLPEATAGVSGLMHYDLRPDNTLIRTVDGTAVVLDWNWTRSGPACVDTIMLLVTAVGQHDVDAALAGHPTTRAVEPDLVDGVLAAVGGSLLRAGNRPAIATSPMLRLHQRHQGGRALTWLAQRRGWRETRP